MYCKYCGDTIEDGIKFCNICGAESSASSEKIKPTAAKSTMTRDKRDPREQYSANKLDAYYSYDNSIINNDNYKQYKSVVRYRFKRRLRCFIKQAEN